jgi:hypothetical protein
MGQPRENGKERNSNASSIRLVKEMDGTHRFWRIAGNGGKTTGAERLRCNSVPEEPCGSTSGHLSRTAEFGLEFVATENLYINQVIIEGLTPPPTTLGSRGDATVVKIPPPILWTRPIAAASCGKDCIKQTGSEKRVAKKATNWT